MIERVLPNKFRIYHFLARVNHTKKAKWQIVLFDVVECWSNLSREDMLNYLSGNLVLTDGKERNTILM